MYHPEDCLRIGLQVYPVAAGRFRGTGKLQGWRLVPTAFVISMVERGAALEHLAWGDVRVGMGELIMLWPHQWHDLTEEGRRPLWTQWLELEGPGLPALGHAFGVRQGAPVVRPRQGRRALTLLRTLIEAQLDPQPLPPSAFWSRLAQLAECCSDAWMPPDQRSAPSLIELASALWQAEQVRALSPHELAERLGVHGNTLLRAARAERGCTAAQLVLEWKVARARTLIKHSELKLRTIAQAAGFSSTSHLVRAVRRFTGLLPSRLRS